MNEKEKIMRYRKRWLLFVYRINMNIFEENEVFVEFESSYLNNFSLFASVITSWGQQIVSRSSWMMIN